MLFIFKWGGLSTYILLFYPLVLKDTYKPMLYFCLQREGKEDWSCGPWRTVHSWHLNSLSATVHCMYSLVIWVNSHGSVRISSFLKNNSVISFPHPYLSTSSQMRFPFLIGTFRLLVTWHFLSESVPFDF